MIIYRKMSKEQGRQFVEEKDSMSQTAFDDLLAKWQNHNVDDYDESYKELRTKVINTFEQYKNVSNYEIDIRVGLCLYDLLNKQTGFDNLKACDDDIWRYLSCKVFPDITHLRYPPNRKDREEGHRINGQRFYSKTRRIWLKTLWWYVHLSWQGDIQSTYEVLKKCSTDTISDLIERTGRGYRIQMYRELMKRFSQAEDRSTVMFNRLQVQNLVNCRTVEPALSKGHEEGYIKRLFDQLAVK